MELSPLEQRYMLLSLDKDGRRERYADDGIGEQAHHLRLAEAVSGDELVADFVDSVTHYASYSNSQDFHRQNRKQLTEAQHRPHVDADLATSSIAWWLERHDPILRDAGNSPVGLEFVARELVPLRTAGQGDEMSRRSRRSRRLDLLLRASDRAPVVAEVKARTDQHPFYALIQALMHVSQLAGASQRERLHAHYPGLQESGRMDVCLVLAGNARYFFEPHRQRKPKFKPQLASEAQRLCDAFVKDQRTHAYVRTITWLEGSMAHGSLVFAERFNRSAS